MNEADLENALNTALRTALGAMPVAWMKVPYSGVKPYVHVQIVKVSQLSDDLKGTYKVGRGRYIPTVVTDALKADGTGPSNAIGETIAAAFPTALRLTAASGHLVVIKPPEIKDGFRDGADWRTPVIVDYETFN